MYKITTLFVLLLTATILQAQTDPGITSWLQNTTGIMGRHYVKGNSTAINDNVEANVQRYNTQRTGFILIPTEFRHT